MSDELRIGVMGAGSIGCFVGGKLLASGVDVVFIGRERLRGEIAEAGLTLQDVEAPAVSIQGHQVRFETDPEGLAECNVVLCCVKSAQTEEVGRALDGILPADALVVSLQNGVRNAPTLRRRLGRRDVMAGIVDFNVVSMGGGVFRRTMRGPISLESESSYVARRLIGAMRGAGVEVREYADLGPHQWAKLVVNLNNSISALSGAPTRDLLLNPGYRRVLAAVVEEGVRVLSAAGVSIARVRGLPPRFAPKLLRMPTFAVRLFARAQMNVDPEARSSMYEDLVRGRKTEVDFLNGEIVTQAERAGTRAPINERIVELVRRAEADNAGPPGFAPAELWSQLTE